MQMTTVLDNHGAADSPGPAPAGGGRQGSGLLGRIGPLAVRLAREPGEVAAAQELRFKIFYDELGAPRQMADALQRRDADRFDAICDHLIVLDTTIAAPDTQRVVGTYRLLRQEGAAAAGSFYSQDEFDLEPLLRRHPGLRFLELGRSCVLPQYRSRRTVELLWQGIWAYCRQHDIDVMMGCASFPGNIPAAHAASLSLLAHTRRAHGPWAVRAVANRYRCMDLMPPEAIDAKSALAAMPPLIKGYLRLGAAFGDGCVVDEAFATTDVFVLLPVASISQRYIDYYGEDAQRFTA